MFLPINFNICFGCSKETSHWDGSFEYPQHVLVEIRKLNFRYTLLTKVLSMIVQTKIIKFFASCLKFRISKSK